MGKRFKRLLTFCFFILIGTGLMQIDQGMAASKANTLILGHLGALSGDAALYGEGEKRSITMAIEEINAKGGITVAGQQYLLDCIHLDHKFRADGAIAGFQRLVELHNIHFINSGGNAPGMALIQINEKNGVLLDIISPTAPISGSGNKLVLSQPLLQRQNDFSLAVEAIGRGWKTMAILAVNNETGREHGRWMTKIYEERGGKVLRAEYVDTASRTDFYAESTKLKALKPDCVFITCHDEPAGRIATQFREVGYTKPFLFDENFKEAGLKIVGINNVEGSLIIGSVSTVISMSPKGTPEKYVKFKERYLKRWPGQNISATGPYSYNWVYYLARAMEIAGTVTDAYKVRAACNQAVAEKDYLTGIKGWTKGGRAYGNANYVLGIENGEVCVLKEFVYTKEMASEAEK